MFACYCSDEALLFSFPAVFRGFFELVFLFLLLLVLVFSSDAAEQPLDVLELLFDVFDCFRWVLVLAIVGVCLVRGCGCAGTISKRKMDGVWMSLLFVSSWFGMICCCLV